MTDINLSAPLEHQTPGAQIQALDPSVAPDSGILTNTTVPSITRVLNPTALALDNPAGTGAPFDRKDQVYHIYSRWQEKNTTVNGSVSSGAELVRISLDPMTLPPRMMDWVLMHRSCIPSIDVSIVVGGAAGTISWLALGWIPDASVGKVDLDDLQTVACEHINMNTTITMRFVLNDNRRSGLFRRLPDDPEPYPGMVLMVNHPALNVQRNDDVNYPIDVYVRFSPTAIFMEPYNIINSNSGTTRRLDLSGLLKLTNMDVVLGTSSVTNPLRSFVSYPDSGWTTGEFRPSFGQNNLFAIQMSADGVNYYMVKDFLPHTATDKMWPLIKGANHQHASPYPYKLFFAYGQVSSDNNHKIFARAGNQPNWNATTYTIPPLTIRMNFASYTCTTIHVYEFGVVMEFNVNIRVVDTSDSSSMMISTVEEESYYPSDGDFVKPAGVGVSPFVCYSFKQDALVTGDGVPGVRYSGPFDRNGSWDDQIILAGVYEQTDRFYDMTMLLVGNQSSTSALPPGLISMNLMRPGTSKETGVDFAFNSPWAPDSQAIGSTLNAIAEQLQSRWIIFDVYLDGFNLGTAAYSDGVLCVRSTDKFMVRTGVSNNVTLENIRPSQNPNQIGPFLTTGFVTWIAGSFSNRRANIRQRFSSIRLEKQSLPYMGLAFGKSMSDGVFGALQMILQQQWMEKYQANQLNLQQKLAEMQINSQQALQKLRNQGQLDNTNLYFDRRLELLGRNNSSSQSGNLRQMQNLNPGETTNIPDVRRMSQASDDTLPSYSSEKEVAPVQTGVKLPASEEPSQTHIPISEEDISEEVGQETGLDDFRGVSLPEWQADYLSRNPNYTTLPSEDRDFSFIPETSPLRRGDSVRRQFREKAGRFDRKAASRVPIKPGKRRWGAGLAGVQKDRTNQPISQDPSKAGTVLDRMVTNVGASPSTL